jgi:TetR/AcrR family transcriptional regulator, cholesterol catabolism regulator
MDRASTGKGLGLRNNLMRNEIRRVAARLFGQYGIKRTTLQSVADELGISKAALYHYYGSKHDLVRDVFADWVRDNLAAITSAISADGSPERRLHRLIQAHLGSLSTDLGTSFREEDQLPADVGAEFRKLKRAVDRKVRAVVEDGIKEGVFEPFDPKVVTFALFGMCNWMWQWDEPKGDISSEELADVLFRLLYQGLARNGRSDSNGRRGSTT